MVSRCVLFNVKEYLFFSLLPRDLIFLGIMK